MKNLKTYFFSLIDYHKKVSYKTSIIIPCFNEEKTVYMVVSNICNQFQECKVIVVDDGSTDKSYIELKKIESKNLNIIKLENNQGKGNAMRKGLESIDDGSEIVIFTDADDEIDPKDIQKVLDKYEKDTDIVAVFGSRFKQISLSTIFKMGLHRYLANRFLTIVSNVIFNQNLTDMETAVKSFRSYLIKDLNLIANGFDIEPEFVKELSRLNVKIDEVSIDYEPRSVKDGKKISFKDGFITLGYLINSRND